MPARSSYSLKPACHRALKKPARSHSWKRSCTVELAPTSRGSAFHCMPVRSIYTMASKALRSSVLRRPPLACDGAGGISGWTRSHTSSLTSHGLVLAIASSSTFFLLFYHVSTGFRISCYCKIDIHFDERRDGGLGKHFRLVCSPREAPDGRLVHGRANPSVVQTVRALPW